jgi:hypothetical protein
MAATPGLCVDTEYTDYCQTVNIGETEKPSFFPTLLARVVATV